MENASPKESFEQENEQELFAEMERNFDNVIHEIVSDRSLDKFREEYEKLHEALVQSHEHNHVLMEKCEQLNKDISANASKIASILVLSHNDQKTVASLRREFEKAWKIVEQTQEKENRSAEIIDSLRTEIENLTVLVQHSDKERDEVGAVSQQQVEKNLAEIKQDLALHEAKMTDMRHEIESTQESMLSDDALVIQYKKDEYELSKELEKCESLVKTISAERESIAKNHEMAEEDIKRTHTKIQETAAVIDEKKKESRKMKDEIARLGRDAKMWTKMLSKRTRQVEKAKDVLADEKHATDETRKKIAHVKKQFYAQEIEYSQFNGQFGKLNAEFQMATNELREMKEFKAEMAKEKNDLVTRLADLRKEYLVRTTDVNTSELKTRQAALEYDRSAHEHRTVTQKKMNEVAETKREEGARVIVQRETSKVKETNHAQKGRIAQFGDDIRNFEVRTYSTRTNVAQVREVIAQTELEIEQGNAHLGEINRTITKSEELCKNTKEERDVLAKDVVKWKTENEELNGEIASLNLFVDNLKESIREKDEECLQIHINTEQMKIVVQELTESVEKTERQLKEALEKCTKLAHDVTMKAHIESEAVVDIRAMNHANNHIRDGIRQAEKQITMRNKEISALREKVAVIRSTCRMGESHYDKIQQKVDTLYQELLGYVEIEKELMARLRNFLGTRREIRRLEKTLLICRGQAKAMEDELETGRNVHRWRLIEATNPELWELICMRLSLINMIDHRTAKGAKFKRSLKEIQEKLSKLDRQLQVSYGGKFEDEFKTVTMLLKQKNRQLKQMENQLKEEYIPAVDEQRRQVRSVRTIIRETKVENDDGRRKVNELRRAVTPPEPERQFQVRPPKFSSRRRAPGRFLGGGFGVGRAEVANEVPSLNLAVLDENEFRQRPKTARPHAGVFVPSTARRARANQKDWSARCKSSRICRD